MPFFTQHAFFGNRQKFIFFFFFSLLFCLNSFVSKAQDVFTWTGASSTDWATAGNWSKSGSAGSDTYPGQTRTTDLVVISNGGSPVLANNASISKLTVSNFTGASTGSTLTINNSFTLTISYTGSAGTSAVLLNGGNIVNNGSLAITTATASTAVYGILCGTPTVGPGSATQYTYSGTGSLSINTSAGTGSSVYFNGTNANSTYKISFPNSTTLTLPANTSALNVAASTSSPVLISGTGFTLGSSGTGVAAGILLQNGNGTNVTIDAGTTLTLYSASGNTAKGVYLNFSTAGAGSFTNNGNIYGYGTEAAAFLQLTNSATSGTNTLTFTNNGVISTNMVVTATYAGIMNIVAAAQAYGTNTNTINNTGTLTLVNTQATGTGLGYALYHGNGAASSGSILTTITNSGSGIFELNGTQTSTGGIAGRLTIANTGTFNLNPPTTGSCLDKTVFNNNSGGILDCKTSAITSYSTYVVSIKAGSTLKTANTGGLLCIAGALPNGAVLDPAANYVFNGSAGQTINSTGTSGAALTANNLQIANSSTGVSLSTSTTVNGTLTLTSGVIATSSYVLTATGAVSRTGGWVNGNLRRAVAAGASTVTYDIGDATNYTPITLTFASGTGAGSLTASTKVPGAAPAAGMPSSGSGISQSKYINRYWSLTNSTLTSPSYSAAFTYINPGDIAGSANTSSLIVGQNNSGTWSNPGVASSASPTVTTNSGQTTFGDFYLGEAISTNANLSALTISSGTLSPSFASGTTAYTASVSNGTTSVTVTPTVSDANATIQARVNGGSYASVTSGSASSSLSLNVGSNTIDVTVTAQDGSTTKTYTITVTRAASTNADLSALTISSGTLSPSFVSGTTAYTASVSNGTTSVTVTPTVSDANATIQARVNGGSYASVTSGSASSSLSLNVGSNTIDVTVTAQDGSTTKTYTITVTRAASTNADLSALTISSGTLSPSFVSGTTAYTASVSNGTTSVTVTPTVSDANATIQARVNGGSYASVTSGSASSSLSLNVGSNTIDITVTAEDGSTTKTYTITVTRAGSSNADLSALSSTAGSFAETFASSTTAYTVSVSNATTSVTVTPTKSDANATIQVRVNGGTYATVTSGSASGALSLNVGANTIDVTVTAQDGTTTKTYTITVTRAASTNADLSALSSTAGSFAETFASSTTAYTVSVSNGTTSVTVTPTKSDANATIQVRVNGGSYASVTSGSASGSLSLNVGSNTIDVTVTAQDGTTTKTYTITVTRAASSNANLSALSPSSGTLSPSFASGTTSYTASVSNATTSITVTATVADATATLQVRVNGGSYASVTSGSASSSLALNVGSNTIDVTVTAQDGTTTKTYTITVTRAASSNADLSSLTISAGTLTPSFTSSTTSYAASVSNTTTSVTVTATKSDANAAIQVRVNGGSYATVASGSASSSLSLNVGSNTIDVTVTAQDGSTTKTYTITVTRLDNTWTGGNSSNWNDPGNWSSGSVPAPTENIVIASGASNTLTISSSVAANNITIASGGLLIVTGTLQINGSITNNGGTFTATSGTIEMNGSSAQNIPASTFTGNTVQNLIVNNSAGVTLSGALNITGVLTPAAGNLVSGGNLTLVSTASATASVAASAGGTITGNVNVQRWNVAQRGYRILSNPYAAKQSLTGLTNYFAITGITGGGTYATSSGNPSAFTYNATAASGSALIPVTSATTSIWNYTTPVFVQVRGSGSQGINFDYSGSGGVPTAFALDAVGVLNDGNAVPDYPLQYSVSGNNYNLVGNPYASPINLKSLQSNGISIHSNSNIGGTFYIYNPTKNAGTAITLIGGYDSYSNDGTTDVVIPSMAAFFIKANTSGQTIQFAESAKTNATPLNVMGTGTRAQLQLAVESDKGSWDNLNIRFDDKATDSVIDRFDAEKWNNAVFDFYSLSAEGNRLCIDSRAVNVTGIIPLGINTNVTDNSFKIKVQNIGGLGDRQIVLKDKLLLTETILKAVGDSYSFAITTDTATKGNNRFELAITSPKLFAPQPQDNNASNGVNVQLSPNPVRDVLTINLAKDAVSTTVPTIIRIISSDGRQLRTQEAPVGSTTIKVSMNNISHGVLWVEIMNDKISTTKTVMKE